ncbi:glycosyltransferase [Flavobacterium sp. NG2]|uniref:glycosyltransferase n=1 Tax=Flavobacterium sp. NG2 TaxID=3097547 RepID=UPI002A82D2C1|nr:glycosyltransferase [Flavobacterium sp. NG2]WPR71591.1 glycosyltransferase [Flavobacterium sp. NG2]
MRILQLIDSLEAGGAERMAVNYANTLAHQIDFSGLVVSRKEGDLIGQINSNVSYLFLNRKRIIDIKALLQLRYYVKKNKVELVHAHSTSFFIAVLLKIIQPKLKIVWHDHYGDSDFLEERKSFVLQWSSFFFNGIIVVNQKLKKWAQEKLDFKNVIYLPNFVSENNDEIGQTILKGAKNKRIVCLANLRKQKNHFLILEVAMKMKNTHPDWTFHLVGKDFNDLYGTQIKKKIQDYHLEKTVFVYGAVLDISTVLKQANIGILSSKSEGLPVALLEYGLHKLAVVVTAVGDIPLLIENGSNGFLVTDFEVVNFYKCVVTLIENSELQTNFGLALYKTISEGYTQDPVMQQYLRWLKKIEL